MEIKTYKNFKMLIKKHRYIGPYIGPTNEETTKLIDIKQIPK